MFSVDPSDAGGRHRRLPRLGRLAVPLVAVAMIGVSVGGFVVFNDGDDSDADAAAESGPAADSEGAPIGSELTRPDLTADEDSGPTTIAAQSSCAVDDVIPRECLMFSPDDVAPDEQLPVVMILHGRSSTPQVASTEGGWRDLLAERRFHVVAPGGFGESWNGGQCCPPASALELDDVAYIHKVLDEVEDHPNVDPTRIHFIGVSNGGIFGYRFLCDSRGRIQTLVSFGGTRLTNCAPDAAVDVLHIHGTSDEVVPFNNGLSLQAVVLGVDFPPVENTMANFAADVGCGVPEPDEAVNGRVVSRRWLDCDGGGNVRFDIVDGAMHVQWMAGYDVAEAMLDFIGL